MPIIFSVCTGVSFLFSIFLVMQNIRGLAFAAAAVGLLYSVLLGFSSLNLKKKGTHAALTLNRKLYEYWSFALIACFVCSRALAERTPRLFDAVLALLWFAIVVLKYTALHFLKEKHVHTYIPAFTGAKKQKKPLLVELLEWVDAAFYAVFFVLLVNIFVFQVYRIPSESMVPEFMIGDTVIGIKTPAGPAFPLSSFRLPQIQQYKRGDIVILHNPNYPDTPRTRLKTFLSQLVYMITFAQVNLNTDNYGRAKADPLVKRIAGVPGEKIMMVDGVLYAKRMGDAGFTPVQDEKRYAQWNLSALPQSELRLVKDIKVNTEELGIIESIENRRKNLDFSEAERQAQSLVNRLALFKNNTDTAESTGFLQDGEYEFMSLFSAHDSISRKVLTTNGGVDWFRSFMTSWIPFWKSEGSSRSSLYDKRFAQMNALIKLCFGKLLVRNIELFTANATAEQFTDDAVRNTLLREAEEYAFYLLWTNQRNMKEFPQEENSYIPDNCFFMMGDNRFNSTDMRHAYFFRLEAIDRYDTQPVLFQSNSDPKYVPAEKILGTTLFRIFPFSRFGVL